MMMKKRGCLCVWTKSSNWYTLIDGFIGSKPLAPNVETKNPGTDVCKACYCKYITSPKETYILIVETNFFSKSLSQE
jgi:hypothetical protein